VEPFSLLVTRKLRKKKKTLLDNRELLVACAVSPAHVSGMPRSEEEEGI